MKDFRSRLGKELLFWDGGMGTELQSRGLRADELPESWNLTHPDAVRIIHADYLSAGADILCANTFGANRIKLGADPSKFIQAGVSLAKQAVEACGRTAYVALDVGPTGKLLAPFGTLTFEDAYDAFAEQIEAGVQAGADLIAIETMTDLYETKAALLAAKEHSDLPVTVSYIFDETGKLLTGADIQTAFLLARSLGADAVGMNCGLGPAQIAALLPKLREHAGLPLSVCANAGLPELIDGKTVYRVPPEAFVREAESFVRNGVSLLGGCCGTTPAHIAALTKAFRRQVPPPVQPVRGTLVSSYTRTVSFGARPLVIGERINPTGKPRLKAALRAGDMDTLLSEAIAQADCGADLLDVNVGLPETDEPTLLVQALRSIQSVCDLPLQLDSASPEALERGLRIYNGRPLVNSVNGSEKSMNAVLPLVKKYGACVVALTLDENGIPASAEGRVAIAKRIRDRAALYGIPPEDLLVDTLTMTVGTDGNAALVTLESMERVRKELGLGTLLGVSNCSFGLPERETLTAAFLTLAMQRGLSGAIVNPLSNLVRNAYLATCALCGWDENCLRYIGGVAPLGATAEQKGTQVHTNASTLAETVERGLPERAKVMAQSLLAHRDPLDIVKEELIPALDRVGKAFEEKRLFLPQLLMSADAARAAFVVVQDSIRASGKVQESKGSVLLATVKDDVHDIGKNIVKVLLESYGFTVVDLGKDVPPETVVKEAVARNIRLIGLSALMTTTVPNMEATVRALKAAIPDCKIIVGGAVLNEECARNIGADVYSPDAMATVRFAEEFFSSR